MKTRIRRYLILAGSVLALLAISGAPEKLYQRHAKKVADSVLQISPLVPKIERVWSVRFDPSYYYRQQRPTVLARELAETWQKAGINLVFYRALDSEHGTFYKTHYASLAMGEFGRYDLLKYVLKECHSRNIKVFVWYPVLNAGEAWKKNPDWRAKNTRGKDHQETGLQFPLCARNPQVRQWWQGVLTDLLDHYPAIDGIDLGEPIVSWRTGEACHCSLCKAATQSAAPQDAVTIRAAALTDLLHSSIETIHGYNKQACVTAVQSAHPDGTNWSFAEMKQVTGFDWPAIATASGKQSPDLICPEFIWQEWRSRPTSPQPYAFTPEWTGQAVREFQRNLNQPVQMIAHVELTDFPRVTVGQTQLRESIRAALRGGADGIDVYSSNELDKKSAWPAMRALRDVTQRKNCLVIHDVKSDQSDAIQTAELLRHFSVNITHVSVDECTGGMMDRFDHVFYVGTDPQAQLPQPFLDEIGSTRATVCWLGPNIEQALRRPNQSTLRGLDFLSNDANAFLRVDYKNTALKKENPGTTVLRVTDPSRCRVWATATTAAMATAAEAKSHTAPYAIQSGRFFWYFADAPSCFAVEGGHYLVFADLLHQILNENHAANHLAMIRIEDVHPLTDPRSLRQIGKFLGSEDVPFQVATVPTYAFPEQDSYVRTSERPDYVAALKDMVRNNGAIVMHGTTHQRFEETTSDYEYWDAVGDYPPEDETEQSIRKRVESGLNEFWRAGLYPLAWETPHYAGSQMLYKTISQMFSVSMERRQSINQVGTDELFPYLIQHDRFGQTIVPENLGYIPLSDRRPEVILEPARKMMVVRDGVASFFYHPFLGLTPMKEIVRGMKNEGFQFVGLRQLPVAVTASNGALASQKELVNLQTFGRKGEKSALAGTGAPKTPTAVSGDANGTFHQLIKPQPGQMEFVNFLPSKDEGIQSSANKITDPEQALQTITNAHGEICRVPWPLLLSSQSPSKENIAEMQSFRRMFRILGVELAEVDVKGLKDLPGQINIVIVPSAAAKDLQEQQVAQLDEALRAGHISVITTGFSRLSERLMIYRQDKSMEVRQVQDLY